MKKVLLLVAIAVTLTACNKREECHHSKSITTIKNPIYVGNDSINIEKYGMLIIEEIKGDSIIVKNATIDDCRRILEENGKG